MNIDKHSVKEFLSRLSPQQMSDLVQELRDDWHLPDAPPPTVVDPRPPSPTPATAFDVVVIDVGNSRIAVIRALRQACPDLDLRSARDLLRGLPAVVGDAVTKPDAQRLADPLRDAGAVVEVRDAAVAE